MTYKWIHGKEKFPSELVKILVAERLGQADALVRGINDSIGEFNADVDATLSTLYDIVFFMAGRVPSGPFSESTIAIDMLSEGYNAATSPFYNNFGGLPTGAQTLPNGSVIYPTAWNEG